MTGEREHSSNRCAGIAVAGRPTLSAACDRRWEECEALLRQDPALIRHGRQVSRLATDLFDGVGRAYGLGPADRERLALAALLHDVGKRVQHRGHQRHGAYLIEHARLKASNARDVAVLASLVRFHRNGVPKASYPPFRSLDRADQQAVRRLAALLCLADGLDRSRAGRVESAVIAERDDRLLLVVLACAEAELDVWGARQKAAALERLHGKPLEVVVAAARPAAST